MFMRAEICRTRYFTVLNSQTFQNYDRVCFHMSVFIFN